MFLARYDLSNGELSWVSNGMPTTGTLPSYATDITMQFKVLYSLVNLLLSLRRLLSIIQSPLVVGTFFEYIQLGEITLNTSAGGRGIFVARYNSSTGEATAARSLNGVHVFLLLLLMRNIYSRLWHLLLLSSARHRPRWKPLYRGLLHGQHQPISKRHPERLSGGKHLRRQV